MTIVLILLFILFIFFVCFMLAKKISIGSLFYKVVKTEWLALNVSGMLIFLIGGQIGIIIDIIRNSPIPNEPISLIAPVGSFVIALILCSMGMYKWSIGIRPNLNKILLSIQTVVITLIELLICYILIFISYFAIWAPIMTRLGYHVTML